MSITERENGFGSIPGSKRMIHRAMNNRFRCRGVGLPTPLNGLAGAFGMICHMAKLPVMVSVCFCWTICRRFGHFRSVL